MINAFAYLASGIFSGHLWRDLIPQLRDWRAIPRDFVEHLKLHFVHGPDAPKYNALQKITYALILFFVLPVLASAEADRCDPAMATDFLERRAELAGAAIGRLRATP